MPSPIYLDNNATTPLDPRVLEAMLPVFREHFGNPASQTHSYGWYADELVEIAREQVASLIGAQTEEIVFTSGATESNNLAIQGVARANMQGRADLSQCSFISVATEHRAILDPLEHLAKQGASVLILDVDSEGNLDSDSYHNATDHKTCLSTVMLANNEIGVIHDVATLATFKRKDTHFFHCDATQAAGKIPVDVAQLGVDLLSLSAHKLYGPKGVGALYIRRGISTESLSALQLGGNHEQGFRSGTLNVAGIVGFGKACELAQNELDADSTKMDLLAKQLLQQISNKVSGIELNGNTRNRIPGNLNIAIEGTDSVRLIGLLQTKLALSASSACQSASKIPSHVLAALGLPIQRQRSSIRIGIGRFTTEEEVECAGEILVGAIEKIRVGR